MFLAGIPFTDNWSHSKGLRPVRSLDPKLMWGRGIASDRCHICKFNLSALLPVENIAASPFAAEVV